MDQKSFQLKIRNLFKKFKKTVESRLGKINWGQVGIFAFALLLFVAIKGLLGPEAQFIATSIVKFAAYA